MNTGPSSPPRRLLGLVLAGILLVVAFVATSGVDVLARALALSTLTALCIAVLLRRQQHADANARALRESEARIRMLLEFSFDLYWETDEQHRFTRLQYSEHFPDAPVPNSELGRTRWEVPYLGPDEEAWRQHRATLDAHRPFRDFEIDRPTQDGGKRYVSVSGIPKFDAAGRFTGYCGHARNITARKRAEEELRESESRFRTLIDHATDAFFLHAEDFSILDVNRQACENLGYSRDELIGMTPLDLDPHADMSGLQSTFRRLAREEIVTLERFQRRKDGSLLPVEIRLRRFIHGGRPRVFALMRDITERKRAESERARLEAELRRSQKMEAIGTLAGGIAHDFNNILGAILGYSELAQRKAGDNTPVLGALDQVMVAGYRGKRLVEHILAFSRSGVGERVPVHVQSVVEEAIELLCASLPPSVRLEKRLQAGDSAVLGDATQLHQVTMNLCTNAIQSMALGGTLTVTLDRAELAEPSPLSHGKLTPGPYVRIEVTDTGTGIPAELLDRIFDPFFTTKSVGEGTGLGLSLVHGFVADFGGAIDVKTREGVGTTFCIWLPAAGEMKALEGDERSDVPYGNGETVMVVDDERPLVELAEDTLAELGYDPAGFNSSLDALSAFRAEPQRYDAVLTDETMPDMAGTELAREIRAIRPDIPIILMSGYSGSQFAERAQAAGVKEILRKPLLRQDIGEALSRVLSAITS